MSCFHMFHLVLISLSVMYCCVFFFKQKTAYEMRISDWSSDVCSSDLILRDRREGDRLEPQHILLGARDALRRDDDEIFDADAEGARLVIAGLVREDHAGVQRLLGPRLSARGLGDALRPLMHRQIGADAVAGAMRIIDAVGPRILPCENVGLAAARSEERR